MVYHRIVFTRWAEYEIIMCFLTGALWALIQLVNSLQPLNLLLCPTAKWMSIVCADSETVT